MRTWTRSCMTQLLIVQMLGLPASARLPATDPYDAFIQDYVAKGSFSGTVLIALNGHILFEKAYGLANIEFDVPNTSQTKFKIYSTTRPFTATAIMLMAQQGKLSVEDSITKYLPGSPSTWNPVAIKHLLSHMSGIPDFINSWADAWDKSELQTFSKVLPQIKNTPLAFQPGSTISYSNSGYELLGCIIERVSGQTYSAFMQDHIFGPSGMSNTGFELPAPIDHSDYMGPVPVKYLATGYNGTPGHPELSRSFMYQEMAAGGIYTTAEDLLRFDQALYGDKLLTARYRNEMFSPAILGKNGNGYGFGWMIRKQFNRLCLRHDGGSNGFTSTLDRYPADRVTIIVESNFGYFGDDLDSFRLGLAAIVFGEKYPVPESN
jgi:CubicO group peptidase (beta-lactamase class C family)